MTNADVYPVWGDVIYWGIVLFPVLFIPVWHLGYYCIRGGCSVSTFSFYNSNIDINFSIMIAAALFKYRIFDGYHKNIFCFLEVRT